MRRAVALVIVAASMFAAACELQPAPKKQPVPVEVVPPPPAQPPTPPPSIDDAGVPADASGPPPIQANEACIKVAAHVV